MENLCEYCKSPYIPKRSDAMYCSQTCKQSAYVLRKAGSLHGLMLSNETTLEDATPKSMLDLSGIGQHYPSIEPGKLLIGQNHLTDNAETSGIYQSAEPEKTLISQKHLTDNPPTPGIYRSAMTDKKDENANEMTDNETKTETEINLAERGEYKEHNSSFLTEITQIIEERDYVGLLDRFLYSGDSDIYWVSGRYKCFLECLLLFSEMKTIQGDDLKELCNAFTHMVYSPGFHSLPDDYPYTNEILKLREKLKSICLNLEPSGRPFPFILQASTRQKFLASRWELSNYFPKISFNELDFT